MPMAPGTHRQSLFVDAAARNPALLPLSPAIDAGIESRLHQGFRRHAGPAGATPDAGAYDLAWGPHRWATDESETHHPVTKLRLEPGPRRSSEKQVFYWSRRVISILPEQRSGRR